MRRTFLAAVILLVVLIPALAGAHVAILTIDDTAQLGSGGNEARVTGAIKCPQGEEFSVAAEVTQNGTVARGSRAFSVCFGGTGTGANTPWGVQTTVVSGPPLQPGSATACATAQTRLQGSNQLHGAPVTVCEPVTLVSDSVNG
jgi:hypothetical protein